MAQRGTGEHTASGYVAITPSDTVNFQVEGQDTVARAIFVGMREAVRQMKELLVRYEPGELP